MQNHMERNCGEYLLRKPAIMAKPIVPSIPINGKMVSQGVYPARLLGVAMAANTFNSMSKTPIIVNRIAMLLIRAPGFLKPGAP
jgi:hypothetical protein